MSERPEDLVKELDSYAQTLLDGGTQLSTNFEYPEMACLLNRAADALEAALAQQPKAEPVLAKHQPCGCVICTCADENGCQGCGAKNCGAHPVGEIPNPIYRISSPDFVAETLGAILDETVGKLAEKWGEKASKLSMKPSTYPEANAANQAEEYLLEACADELKQARDKIILEAVPALTGGRG